ncbi:MAG: DNA polymerase (family 10) [Marivirga sp.]
MENKQIIKLLKQTTKLMELFGENDFKIRSYNSAVFNIEKADVRLADLSQEALNKIDGIGKSISATIYEIATTGQYSYLNELREKTPAGVLDMMQLSGFGPKKVKLLWEELQIETLEDLIQACKENKVATLKGFAEKTQAQLMVAAKFRIGTRGFLHFREAELLAKEIIEFLTGFSNSNLIGVTGGIRRKLETINVVEILIATNEKSKVIKTFKEKVDFEINPKLSGPLKLTLIHLSTKVTVDVLFCKEEDFVNELYRTSASPRHLSHILGSGESIYTELKKRRFASEEAFYKEIGLPFIPVELREGLWEFDLAAQGNVPKLVVVDDLKGILHNHSTYSDGAHTLEQMATYCKSLGYQYLGISDHSKTAVYANGLSENRVKEQHQEIDLLNQQLAPFRILKGIESDILNDGSLDYSDEILETFDFVVASIHAQLNMDEQTATERLIKAIANPYTTMLGHPTGRLLLKRKGYPINHKAVIDACAEYGVIIEINAHPWRLDLDWRHVKYALDKGVKIAVNPDAHEEKGYHDMYYGVCVGRKAALSAEDTFNALSLDEVVSYFDKRKERASVLLQNKNI